MLVCFNEGSYIYRTQNRGRTLGDLNFYIPAKTYGIVECAHSFTTHMD